MAGPGAVTEVVAGLSDPHRGGRQVFSVTFANGRRLIYKPKDMGIDVAYNALLAWLNAAGAPITLRPLRVLDRHSHGWVECAEPAPCADRAAVTRYYQRAGALTVPGLSSPGQRLSRRESHCGRRGSGVGGLRDAAGSLAARCRPAGGW